MSLQKTLYIISQNPIYIKNYGNDFKVKHIFNINSKFSTVYKNCGKCVLKRHFQYKLKFGLQI